MAKLCFLLQKKLDDGTEYMAQAPGSWEIERACDREGHPSASNRERSTFSVGSAMQSLILFPDLVYFPLVSWCGKALPWTVQRESKILRRQAWGVSPANEST